jgi:hypothetical protein
VQCPGIRSDGRVLEFLTEVTYLNSGTHLDPDWDMNLGSDLGPDP